ncbi:hypothetical protein AVEN_107952-1 [Araneus ventricosus]|uniref:DUF4817 domain-containing protein n=1 Tax=Araneus ventricosus TaxID=182803 RepID=A0A4Y2JIB7_ARAVE|nr:hypothetical protein AVEN_107952-1 [Araneus ventricosus]
MKPWTIEHCVFKYDSFVEDNESVTAFHREFRLLFPPLGTILRWVLALRTRDTLMRKRPSGDTRTLLPPPLANSPPHLLAVKHNATLSFSVVSSWLRSSRSSSMSLSTFSPHDHGQRHNLVGCRLHMYQFNPNFFQEEVRIAFLQSLTAIPIICLKTSLRSQATLE